MQRSAERAEFLADIITTAVEGGINYWAVVRRYQWFSPTLDGGSATPGPNGEANAVVLLSDDIEEEFHDANRHVYTVDLDAIARVMSSLQTGTPKGWNDGDVKRMVRASRENDAGEIDAGDADCIVQLACFGEVMYG